MRNGWDTPSVGLGRDGTEAQVLAGIVNADGVDELAGVHAVVGVPECFELAEGLHELGAEHLGEQRCAGLAVAVLAGERSAEAEDEIGGAVEELSKGLNAGG